MTQQKNEAAHRESFSEDAIAEYLRNHPDFFERHGALLLRLRLPHQTNGFTVSLVERQVAMLRHRNGELERQLKDLIGVAKSNDALVEKIHQLGLRLMHAANAPARLEALETSLREDFAAERAVLVLFQETAPADATRDGFVKRLSANDADVRPFTAFLKAGRPRCGPLRDRQKSVFDRDADAMCSAALIPLGEDAALGFLIIGSRDADHFHPGKRMDFLVRLGESISVALGCKPLQRGA